MNLPPVEAINRINESVTVEMLVQRRKCCTGSRQVFLDSEASHRDPNNRWCPRIIARLAVS